MTRPARTRLAAALVVGALTVPLLAGCGDGRSSYCSTLREDRTALRSLAGGTGKDPLGRSLRLLDGLREKAPDDIADEWDTLVTALRALDDAVRASGAQVSGFSGGRRPPGVTDGQLAAVRQAAEELRSTRVQQAGASIEQHARDVCEVDLGGGLGGTG